jgi:hypothetical protein
MMSDMIGRSPPLMSIKHGRKSKGDRFEGWLAPRFKNGQIWITDTPTPFIREFKNEWMGWDSYPNDDCLDGAYMCAQKRRLLGWSVHVRAGGAIFDAKQG